MSEEFDVEKDIVPVALEEEQGEQPPRENPLYENSDQHRLVVQFLEDYGVDTSELTEEEVLNTYNKIQSLADEQVQVLSRGAVNDTLERLLREYVPKTHRGEYIHDSPTEIDRAKAMGWTPVVDEEANKDSLTPSADNFVRCGDLVLMMKPVEEYVAMNIARERRHAARRARRQREKQDPSQGAQGVDPMGGRLAASPEHPVKPIEQLTS